VNDDRPRAIFFGSPDFAVPCLDALVEVADVAAVITQPDRRAGRGMRLHPPAVKARAQEHGLSVLQPTKVRTPDFAESLQQLRADVGIVVAYGRILPRAVLEAPSAGCLNVHASLLPRWRGAAPVQWAIANGDRESGVCLMRMDEGLDTGPVVQCRATEIGPDETAADLSERLSALGADLLRAQLQPYLDGAVGLTPQDDAQATRAPPLRKEDGRIDWGRPARAVHDHIRGMTPWPGAFTHWDGKRVKVLKSRVAREHDAESPAGTVVHAQGDRIEVACAHGAITLEELQLEGRRRVLARDFLAGTGLDTGERFEAAAAERARG
jgi:methionyl-tRNA formyltransferase